LDDYITETVSKESRIVFNGKGFRLLFPLFGTL
jgi:hypothetical protein